MATKPRTDEVTLNKTEKFHYIFRAIDKDDYDFMKARLETKGDVETQEWFQNVYGFSILAVDAIGIIDDESEDNLRKFITVRDMEGEHGNGVWVESGKVVDMVTYEERKHEPGMKLRATEKHMMTQKMFTVKEAFLRRTKHLNPEYGIIYRRYQKAS